MTLQDAGKAYGGSLQGVVKKRAGISRVAVTSAPLDTLDQAAKNLKLSPEQLQKDLTANIRGAASILSEDARLVSPTHQLPTTIAGWRPALEMFSNANTRFAAHLYASRVYTLVEKGFSIKMPNGRTISVRSQDIPASVTSLAAGDDPAPVAALPDGCSNDGKTDYPGAINCILDPAQHDCDLVPGDNAPCNYFSSAHYSPTFRQGDGAITHVVIHDIEGSATSAINSFQNPNSVAAAHYIVDKTGTIYQIIQEKDVAFQAGNLWYNMHSVGIEHEGVDATGFNDYNSVEYQASAKLTAYLLQKYNIPADHDHIVSHGTIPGPNLANTPNNVDPGPYWLWSYYLGLVRQSQLSDTALSDQSHIITLRPDSARKPLGENGTETNANFNFFYLYTGPSTKSGLIPQANQSSDITDETNNVEPEISYYYTDKVQDPAGTGDTMYQIWYGEFDPAAQPAKFVHAKQAWLAVPPGAAFAGKGTAVTLKSADGTPVQISGKPGAGADFYIGDAPSGSLFVSSYTVTEDGTNNVWYEINYNHRQAWVPASSVVVAQ